MTVLLSMVSICATVVCVFMLSAPVLTIRTMAVAKSIGVLTVTYFCAQLINCTIWALYGVQKSAAPVMFCNGLGVATATYCVLNFVTIARVEERSGNVLASTTYKQTAVAAMASMAGVVAILVFIIVMYNTVGPEVTVTVNGLMGACASVVMLSSPLGAAKDIIRSKNAQALQPVTVVCATLNSILWTLYGILTVDIMIAVPNALCTLACLFQGFLIIHYGRRATTEVTVENYIPELPVA